MQKYTNEGIFQKQRASGAALQGSAFIAQEVGRFMAQEVKKFITQEVERFMVQEVKKFIAQEVKNAMMRCEVLQGYWCS